MMDCIGLEQLLGLARGRVDTTQADQIRAHLASGCSRCQTNLEWLQKTLQLVATDDSVEPPDWIVRRAIRLFEEYGPRPRPKLLGRLAAALTFDNLAQAQPVGVRQTGPATRQCVYQAGDWDIDLGFEAGEQPDTIDLTGQVLRSKSPADEAANVWVRLSQGGQVVASTVTDRLGEFTFDSVADGTYDLTIELSEQEIQIEGLEVKLNHG